MKIDILTLFPNMIEPFFNDSIIKRAIDKKIVSINVVNFRDFASGKKKQVDDEPYGGGCGMILMCEPIVKAIESLKTKNSKVILLTPQGNTYKQEIAYSLAKEEHLILICGHYEGFDERIRHFVDMELSIGDFVLTGGEIPAVCITDSIVRLLPGVIKEDSHKFDSFSNGMLDYPNYTRPENFRGFKVPEVLLSGNHKKIDEFRKEMVYNKTIEKRPDLLK